ncbi:GNAT family N-acetyltransferase [Kribbella sp. CA-293567]|uniref:GNAT family N-acetyltransferase n=1 Tax=Kribbella sp. CA-293567 TaxID=3002436 RepID=UPI0022DD2F2A|nr:GNAT family N-acetyltransferase [Kribbella sp. CA-293567]WBQ01937.1 GNAT family N-acetyltransferase [Kribbella sp. CA-293567]
MEIRPATTADLPGIAATSAALFAEDAGQRDPFRNQAWPAAHGEQWIADLHSNPAARIFVAADGAEVVGHLIAIYEPPSDMWLVPRAELVSMFVRPPVRGRGLGGQLVDAFTIWARARGAVRLQVTAYATNEAAQRLYQSRGFKPASVVLANDL